MTQPELFSNIEDRRCPECGCPVETRHVSAGWIVTCTDDNRDPCAGMPYSNGETKQDAEENWRRGVMIREELQNKE